MIKTRNQTLEDIYNSVQEEILRREIIIKTLEGVADEEVIYTKQEWSRINGMVEREYTKKKIMNENTEEIKRLQLKLEVIKKMIAGN